MTDQIRYVRKCPECGYLNPPDRKVCARDFAFISLEEPVSVPEADAPEDARPPSRGPGASPSGPRKTVRYPGREAGLDRGRRASGTFAKTQRFDAGEVEKFRKPSATGDAVGARTRRFDESRTSVPAPAPDGFIAERYRIEGEPLGHGNTEIYRCTDTETGDIVAVKAYHRRDPANPAAAKRLMGLNHPGIVVLLDVGVWEGRVYEAMEYCAGGSLAEAAPVDEDALRRLLTSVVDGLAFVHQAGVIHRDIKPGNILFRDPDRTQPVLADFDISSIQDSVSGTGERRTGTAGNMTIDYAAPELLLDGTISLKSDYFSLGITVAHALTGHSPFHGMPQPQVISARIFGTLPLPESLAPSCRALIEGLTDFSPDNRWGADQTRAWLDGRAVLDDRNRPWYPSPTQTKAEPYPGFPQARTPQELAAHLGEFDAKGQIYDSDDLGHWVFHNFSADLGERIRAIRRDIPDDRRLGLFKLRYLLDPSLPLEIGDRRACEITELVNLLAADEVTASDALTDLLFAGRLECWVDAARPISESATLAAKLAALRERLELDAPGNRELVAFALLHTLDPVRPVRLQNGVELSNPSEFVSMYSAEPARSPTRAALVQLVLSTRLEEWLRAAEFDGWEDELAFIQECRERHSGDPELVVFGALCRLNSQQPMPFGKRRAATPKDFVALVDSGRRSQRAGIDLLRRGWIRTWLAGTGRLSDGAAFDRLVGEAGVSWETKLEGVLQLLDPQLPRPLAVVVPDKLDFGRIPIGDRRASKLKIRNKTRGHLAGEARLVKDNPGVILRGASFEGASNSVQVEVNTEGIPAGSWQRAEILVTGNGGEVSIPVRYCAAVPLRKMLFRSAIAGVWGAVVLGGLRASLPPLENRWFSIGDIWGKLSGKPGVAWDLAPSTLLGYLLIVAFLGFCFLLIRRREKSSIIGFGGKTDEQDG